MKILHVISALNIGGAEKMLTELLPCLKSDRNEISLLILGSYNEEFVKELIRENLKIIKGGIKNIYSISNILILKKNFKNQDIIHVHLFPSLYLCSLCKFLFYPKTKMVYTEHNTYNKRRNKRFLRYIEKFIYSQYNIIGCISEATRINLLKWLFTDNYKDSDSLHEKYRVVYNGIHINKYSEALPARLDIKSNKKIIMMVSRFSKQKDHETLIRAYRNVLEKYDNSILVFVGDGDTKKDMEILVNESGLKESVLFFGSRNDVPNLMKAAYVGVQSSYWEGFGLTAIEFMAAGKPVIASDVDGLNSVVKDAGILFPQSDDQKLSDHILKLLTDNCFYQYISKKCFENAKFYSIESTADNYIQIYKDLI